MQHRTCVQQFSDVKQFIGQYQLIFETKYYCMAVTHPFIFHSLDKVIEGVVLRRVQCVLKFHCPKMDRIFRPTVAPKWLSIRFFG